MDRVIELGTNVRVWLPYPTTIGGLEVRPTILEGVVVRCGSVLADHSPFLCICDAQGVEHTWIESRDGGTVEIAG